MWRETYAKIDLTCLAHNVRALKSCLAPNVKLMATVKANAYGHGAVAISLKVLEVGADQLAVATVEEAVQLRDAGITTDILVYGALPIEAADAVVSHHIMQTVFTLSDCFALSQAAKARGERCRVHVKIDTGMNRLGVKDDEEAVALFTMIHDDPWLDLVGAYTHFTSSDEPLCDLALSETERQRQRFIDIISLIKAKGIAIPVLHASSSAGLLRDARYHFDMVRPGISLYGYHPSPYFGQDVDLRPVLSLETHIVRLHSIAPGEAVSYGRTFIATKMERIATLPIGYADGVPRGLSNVGSVSIRGVKAPIVGRVCMDQMMVLVTDIPDVQVGDKALLYGGDVGSGFSLTDAAQQLDTITYELLCRISDRVKRVYSQ